MAERIVDEAVKFTATCAAFPDARLRPSRVVDEGWHALILHTRVYSELCEGLGHFVHHMPEPPNPFRHDAGELTRTQEMIARRGSPWMTRCGRRRPIRASGSRPDVSTVSLVAREHALVTAATPAQTEVMR
ncbi:hypothetical protein [Streptomyces sp. NPDC094472]|uniref:hypothetical protein n=1 Tax=Streptomyces sp. NPDC094472 TaxID=3155080 RepID=UPI00332E4D40